MAIYEKLKTLTDSVVSVKSALKAKGASIDGASLSYLADKTSRLPVWDSFKSPLAQLGYTSEDEAIYKDLKIDMTTVKEDVEYSLGLDNTDVQFAYRNFAGDKTLKYCPTLDVINSSRMHGVFAQCSNLLTIPIFDCRNVASFQDCFSGCDSLLYAPVVNITSKTNTLSSMFRGCKSITSYDFSTWDTSGVTSLYMFLYENTSLKSVDVSKFDTSNVDSLYSTFTNCRELQELDVSNWNTSNVTSMYGTFCDCSNLENLDVSNWDTSNVTNMYCIFKNCKKLEALDLSRWDTSNVKNIQSMFYGCTKLAKIDMSGCDLSKITSVSDFFTGCTSLDVLKIGNFGSWNFQGILYLNTLSNIASTDEGLKALRFTLIENSFDRVAAGYAPFQINLHKDVKARLTDEEKAAITAKGFTIA